jgi:hypothetical protein
LNFCTYIIQTLFYGMPYSIYNCATGFDARYRDKFFRKKKLLITQCGTI